MVMHIIVLIFEILYYSMFMKFTKKDGKFWKYLLLFTLITLVGLFILVKQDLFSYLVLILMMLYGLKYIIGLKISLYDMFLIVLMLLFKLIIEFVLFIPCYEFFKLSQFTSTMIFDFVKIFLLIIFKNNLYKFNIKLKKLWYNNNFYIRYIFTCLTYVYVILTLLLFIFYNFA